MVQPQIGIHTTLGRRLIAYPEIGLALFMVLIFTISAVRSRTVEEPGRPGVQVNLFLKPNNLHQIARDSSYIAIMAVGATLVMVCGGVDLSIGSIFCLSAIVAAHFISATTYTGRLPVSAEQELEWIAKGEMPSAAVRIVEGVAAGLATGTLCGLINGLLITSLKSPPFLITLGTMQIFRFLAYRITLGKSVGSLPDCFVNGFGKAVLPGGFNVHVPLMISVVGFGWLFLSHSVPGRMAMALGGNEEAARTAGLPVQKVKVAIYAIAGSLGGLAGVLSLAYSGAIQSGEGTGVELTVIAAAVLGGASLTGGRGTAIGALLGALFLLLINNSLIILKIDQDYQLLVIGLVIVTAAASNRLRERMLGAS